MNNKLKYKKLRGAQGNVLAVISDTKNADGTAKVVSATDYYPFGMGMPGRKLYRSRSRRFAIGV